MTTLGQVTIYAPSGKDLITTTLKDESRYTHAFGAPEEVLLRFDRVEPIPLPYGAYITYEGRLWTLYSHYTPEMEDGLARYEVTLSQPSALLSQVAMLYTKEGRIEGDFDLTDSIGAHARVLQDNLTRRYPDMPWNVRISGLSDTTHKHISYQSVSTSEAISKIVEAWACYWWAEGTTIYIGRTERGDEPREVRLGEIAQRINPEGERKPRIGRLYVYGSKRNIPPTYRAERLALPIDNPYLTSHLGEEGGREHVEIFDDVYPRYTGRVASVSTEGKAGEEVYSITDTGTLVSRDNLLEGKTLVLSFTSGALNGMDFEAQIIEGKGYKIVPNETYGTLLPSGHIIPVVGDQYVPHGFDISLVGEQYVPQAEQELLRRAQQWLDEQDNGAERIEVITNPVYMQTNGISFTLGDRVRLITRADTLESKLGTVSRVEYPLSLPQAQTITLSDGKLVYRGILGQVFAEAEAQRQRMENLTKAIESKQAINQLYIEYSEDGTSDWHALATTEDRYIRQRVGANGIWSSPLQIRGEDVLQVQVWSESGTQFINGAVETTLVAFVYRGSKEIGDTLPSTAYRWTRKSANTDTDRVWNALNSSKGRTLRLTPEDVDRSAHFTVIVTTD